MEVTLSQVRCMKKTGYQGRDEKSPPLIPEPVVRAKGLGSLSIGKKRKEVLKEVETDYSRQE